MVNLLRRPGGGALGCLFLALLILLSLAVPFRAEAAKKSYTYETDPIRLGNKALEEGRLDDAKTNFDEALTNEYQQYRRTTGWPRSCAARPTTSKPRPSTGSRPDRSADGGTPAFPEATPGLGLVLLRLGRSRTTPTGRSTSALKIKGSLWQAQYGMARVAIDKGDFDQALKLLAEGGEQEGRGRRGGSLPLRDGARAPRQGTSSMTPRRRPSRPSP